MYASSFEFLRVTEMVTHLQTSWPGRMCLSFNCNSEPLSRQHDLAQSSWEYLGRFE